MSPSNARVVLLGGAPASEVTARAIAAAIGLADATIVRATRLEECVEPLIDGGVDLALLDLDDPAAGGLNANLQLQALSHDAPIAPFHSNDALGGLDPGQLRTLLDIAARKRAARRAVIHRATHDRLTNLANLWLLEDRLDQAVARAERDHVAGALLFVDLDNFKQVNDGLGHEAGNEVLQRLAWRLSRALRKNDTIGRFGGDEFVIILERIEARRQAEIVAEKARRLIEQPISTRAGEARVGASIGVAFFPEQGAALGALVDCADAQMFEAKRAKKRFDRGFAFAGADDDAFRRPLQPLLPLIGF